MLLSADGFLAVAVQSAPVGATGYDMLAAPAVVHVDDSAVNDPLAYDSTVSDPLEDGSQEHPFDSIQEAIQAVASGGQVLVADGTYGEALTIDKNLTLAGGYNGYDWDQPRDSGRFTTIVDASGLNHSVVRILDVDVTMDGFTLAHGSAPAGGGIYCDGGNQVIRACSLVRNNTWSGASTQPGGDGGGIYVSNASILLDHCDVSWNQTGDGGQGLSGSPAGRAGHGGGLFAISSTVEITNCSFSDTTGTGGSDDQGHAVSGNGGEGGAIYAESSTLTISTSQFDYNHTGPGGDKGYEYGTAGAGGNGGALCLRAGSAAQIVDCTFDDNATGSGGDGTGGSDSAGGRGGHGGTIFCESSTLAVENSSFAHSKTGDGGELGMYYASGTSDGGALYALSSIVGLTNCEFVFNETGRTGYYRYARSSGRGGAACFLESAVTIDGCLFQQNKTGEGMQAARGNGPSGRGGGLFFDACPSVQVRNCTIAENGTGDLKGTDGENLNRTGDGGGLAILNSLARVENTLIYGNFTGDGDDSGGYANSSGNGGGVYCENNTEVVIAGCTIAGNRCGVGGTSYYIPLNGSGGGVYTDATTFLVNTILWANMQHDVVGVNAANVRYCDVTDWAFDGINHNVSANPHFVDMANNNYLLRPDSPCIDQGDDAAVSPGGMIDLGGNSRIAGSAVDMGAYEYHVNVLPPGNVAELTAAGGERQVSLRWTNPDDADFAGV
ncbi:MAG: choice-of-anchor Q domain-containing protein, partial [Phycisphaerales bacterium]